MIQKKDILLKAISHIVLITGTLLCIIPFIMLLSISFTDEVSIVRDGFSLFPREFSTEAYRMLFSNMGTMLRAYGVTTFVTISGTLLTLLVSTQMAYVLSRRDFCMAKSLSMFLLITMLFSGGLVPSYILITRYLNLKNNLLAIILPHCAAPWNIFVLKSYMRTVPTSLIEAASIDGANEFYIFYRIVVPIVMGGVATIGIFVTLGLWNEWNGTMLYMTDPKLYSLQYLLQTLMKKVEALQIAAQSGAGMVGAADLPKHSLRMATCVMAVGPIVLAFAFFQKYLVNGITVGAVKE